MFKELMGYCRPRWISDFMYSRFEARVRMVSAMGSRPAETTALAERSLLGYMGPGERPNWGVVAERVVDPGTAMSSQRYARLVLDDGRVINAPVIGEHDVRRGHPRVRREPAGRRDDRARRRGDRRRVVPGGGAEPVPALGTRRGKPCMTFAFSSARSGSTSSPAEEEARLIDRSRAGDATAFSQLVAWHQGRVRAYIGGSISRADVVDDLAQEVFLAAFRSLDSYKGDAPLGVWLLGIARHKTLMHVRGEMRRLMRETGSLESVLAPFRIGLLESEELDLPRREREITALERCLQSLPAGQRRPGGGSLLEGAQHPRHRARAGQARGRDPDDAVSTAPGAAGLRRVAAEELRS